MSARTDVSLAILNIINNMTFSTPIQDNMTWQLVSNRLRLWGEVSPDQQPAAFLVSHREHAEQRGIGLYRRRIEFGIWCYTRSDSTPGSEQLDILLDAFDAAFNVPDNFSTNCNTLGGLVYWCRIEGRVFRDPGDLDNQTLLIVPLIVEMP